MDSTAGRPIQSIVEHHAGEAAFLSEQRDRLIGSPHVDLPALARIDERLAAHLDGVAIAEAEGHRFPAPTTETASAGDAFLGATRALEEQDLERLGQVYGLCLEVPSIRCGLFDALQWAPPGHLRGTVRELLVAEESFRRQIGVVACDRHRVDPGSVLKSALNDADVELRRCAVIAAGVIGRVDLAPTVTQLLADESPGHRLWAASSAILLGNRGAAVKTLRAVIAEGDLDALHLYLQVASIADGHDVLVTLRQNPLRRDRIVGAGVIGNSAYAPWLLELMADPLLARAAGEAFTLITGLDLFKGFEVARPEHLETNPSEDPDDEDVALDRDEHLPFPDVGAVQEWWAANAHRFQQGRRYFLGAPVTREHCIHVLKTGYQRQRILAANYLCLLDPGTPLFNTSAPAWRQQRLLAQM